MEFKDEDKKQLQNLIALLKRAHFKEMTTGEAMTLALVSQWLFDLKAKIEAPTPAPVLHAAPSVEGKKKK